MKIALIIIGCTVLVAIALVVYLHYIVKILDQEEKEQLLRDEYD